MDKKFLIFLLILILPFASSAFIVNHPSNNDLTTSPTIYVNISSGTAIDCLMNYNEVKNVSMNCNGETLLRLPSVDGSYNLSFYETYPSNSSQHFQIQLKIPSGLVVSLYSVIFIAILFFLIFLLLYAFGKLVTLDFDLLDLCLNVGAFFALLGFREMQIQYLGSEFINNWVLEIIGYSTYTNVWFPFIAFLMTITLGTWLRAKYPNIWGRMPGNPGRILTENDIRNPAERGGY